VALTFGWEQDLAASIFINEDAIIVENITESQNVRGWKGPL